MQNNVYFSLHLHLVHSELIFKYKVQHVINNLACFIEVFAFFLSNSESTSIHSEMAFQQIEKRWQIGTNFFQG